MLRKADVIIYDRLAGHRLPALARPGAEVIYVGKSPDRHTLKQAEINRLLVAKAREGKLVVRLKGTLCFWERRRGSGSPCGSRHRL